MGAVAHAHQDRPHFQPAGLHFQDVAHARGGIGIGKDQHIRRAFKARSGKDAVADGLIQRGVDMHFAFIGKVGFTGMQQFHCLAHPVARRGIEVPELRMRTERHLGTNAKAAHMTRGTDHGIPDLLRRRFGVNMRVCDEQRAVFQDHQAERGNRMVPAARQDLAHIVQVPQILAEGAADQTVRFSPVHHDGGNCRGVGAHHGPRYIGRHAAPRHQLVIGAPVVAIAGVVLGVDQPEIAVWPDRQAGAFAAHGHHIGTADQDRHIGGVLDQRKGGAQHTLILAFGKDDPPRRCGRSLEDRAHDQGRAEDRPVQLVTVGLQIGQGPRRNTGFHRGLGNGMGDHPHQARVKRLGDQVIRAESHLFALIGGGCLGACGGAGQVRDSFDAGQLHRIVDLRGPHIQRAPEDEGKAQHVVDLIGKVRPARGNDGIGRDGTRGVGHDFRVGVGQRKDDRARRHFRDHVRRQHAGAGQAQEQVGPCDHLVKRTRLVALRVFGLLRRHLGLAAMMNQARQIAQPDILAPHAQLQQHVQAGDARRPAASGDDLDPVKPFARDMQRIGGRRPHDDGRAMLVIVEHRNVHPLAAQLFDDEAVGGLDVFQIDRAKGGFQRTDDGRQLYRVRLVQLDVETVDIGEFLEQNRLAFHHRL